MARSGSITYPHSDDTPCGCDVKRKATAEKEFQSGHNIKILSENMTEVMKPDTDQPRKAPFVTSHDIRLSVPSPRG